MKLFRLIKLVKNREVASEKNYSFLIDATKYFDLPSFPITDLSGYRVTNDYVEEIYTNYERHYETKHISLKFSITEGKKEKSFYVVWIATEKVWLAFEYSKKEVASKNAGTIIEPYVGTIYRINEEIAKVIKKKYTMAGDISEIYRISPVWSKR